jgi:hypothetical protein
VAFVDHDDLLTPDALYEIAAALARRPETDILYSDEDKIDDAGNFTEPHFKPDWCPESFLSRMYVGHLLVCRRAAVEAAGAFRSDFDGSQDYDLVLRLSERTERIVHIPRVLYHWRVHAASTAAAAGVKAYARGAAERALNAALERRGERGRIEALPDSPGVYSVRFEIGQLRRVSVIVPTRDHGAEVDRCLKAALGHTAYPDLEVILVDNGSTDAASLDLFTALAAADPISQDSTTKPSHVRAERTCSFSTMTPSRSVRGGSSRSWSTRNGQVSARSAPCCCTATIPFSTPASCSDSAGSPVTATNTFPQAPPATSTCCVRSTTILP